MEKRCQICQRVLDSDENCLHPKENPAFWISSKMLQDGKSVLSRPVQGVASQTQLDRQAAEYMLGVVIELNKIRHLRIRKKDAGRTLEETLPFIYGIVDVAMANSKPGFDENPA